MYFSECLTVSTVLTLFLCFQNVQTKATKVKKIYPYFLSASGSQFPVFQVAACSAVLTTTTKFYFLELAQASNLHPTSMSAARSMTRISLAALLSTAWVLPLAAQSSVLCF